jgi:hypothetical protein
MVLTRTGHRTKTFINKTPHVFLQRWIRSQYQWNHTTPLDLVLNSQWRQSHIYCLLYYYWSTYRNKYLQCAVTRNINLSPQYYYFIKWKTKSTPHCLYNSRIKYQNRRKRKDQYLEHTNTRPLTFLVWYKHFIKRWRVMNNIRYSNIYGHNQKVDKLPIHWVRKL